MVTIQPTKYLEISYLRGKILTDLFGKILIVIEEAPNKVYFAKPDKRQRSKEGGEEK